MPATPRCAECRTAMEEGFLTDTTSSGTIEMHWHPGPPERSKFLGIEGAVKTDAKRMLSVRTFRCPKCGLLRSFALPKPEKR
jgi:hypothetical protein